MIHEDHILKRPLFVRTEIVEAKILSFLSDGEVRGFREIQRRTEASPTTLAKYLSEWVSEGKVDKVLVGKRPKYRISRQGVEELRRLTQNIVINKKRASARLISKSVTLIPTIDSLGAASVRVTIGVKKGTPDPPNIDIGEIVKGVEEITRKVRDELHVDYVKIESVVGSPSLQESNESSNTGG